MGIEDLPVITCLEKFVQKLPKEHQAEVYMVAESFYHIGAGDGAMVGALSQGSLMSGLPQKPMEDRGAQYRAYFAKKIKDTENAAV